jgi:hypothetical protein
MVNDYDPDDLEVMEDKYVLNVYFILNQVILKATQALSKGIESGKLQDGMTVKNLEVDQAVNIGLSIDLFTQKEFEEYMKGFCFDSDIKDPLIVETRKANYKLGFVMKKIQAKRPKLVKGVI